MNEVERLLAEKEAAYQRVRREIESLRLAAALLAEPSLEEKDQHARGLQPAAAPLPPPLITATPPSATATETRPRGHMAHGTTGGTNRTRAAAPEVFPQAQDGFIVCDGCGHRNPEFLLDCERCDLPIRLRP
jgi:hypothetical protein